MFFFLLLLSIRSEKEKAKEAVNAIEIVAMESELKKEDVQVISFPKKEVTEQSIFSQLFSYFVVAIVFLLLSITLYISPKTGLLVVAFSIIIATFRRIWNLMFDSKTSEYYFTRHNSHNNLASR